MNYCTPIRNSVCTLESATVCEPKHTEIATGIFIQSLEMNFRQLILLLADKVGHHHLPVRAEANELGEFLSSDAVHHELITKVVKAIYKANHCGYLDAPISKEITFSTLGKLQREIAHSKTADIDQYNLINEFGNVLSNNFIEFSSSPSSSHSKDQRHSTDSEDQPGRGEIYAFKPSRLSLLGPTFIRK